MQGVIVKALSGFYYVKTDSETVECRARGRFRLDGSSPTMVGEPVGQFYGYKVIGMFKEEGDFYKKGADGNFLLDETGPYGLDDECQG